MEKTIKNHFAYTNALKERMAILELDKIINPLEKEKILQEVRNIESAGLDFLKRTENLLKRQKENHLEVSQLINSSKYSDLDFILSKEVKIIKTTRDWLLDINTFIPLDEFESFIKIPLDKYEIVIFPLVLDRLIIINFPLKGFDTLLLEFIEYPISINALFIKMMQMEEISSEFPEDFIKRMIVEKVKKFHYYGVLKVNN